MKNQGELLVEVFVELVDQGSLGEMLQVQYAQGSLGEILQMQYDQGSLGEILRQQLAQGSLDEKPQFAHC